jgi:hypothetical protein
MIVDMIFVYMSCHDKGMISFGEAQGKLPPDFICLLRRNLSGLKRLPDMLGENVMLALISAGDVGVLLFR